jgi:hypothetical protein
MDTKSIRKLESDSDLAASYGSDRFVRPESAEDLAIKTNTSILVSIDGKDVELTAADLIKTARENNRTVTAHVAHSSYHRGRRRRFCSAQS